MQQVPAGSQRFRVHLSPSALLVLLFYLGADLLMLMFNWDTKNKSAPLRDLNSQFWKLSNQISFFWLPLDVCVALAIV